MHDVTFIGSTETEVLAADHRSFYRDVRSDGKRDEEEKDKTYHRIERSYGEFRRVLPLSSAVKDDEIEAKFTDGVLKVLVPKTEEAKTRRIEVKS
ncbi:MAG: Hsp20 family protein [Pirellulaceae bacterium]|nr:Hsp20 family protein [Pirellulaceae bacterium]HJN10857.1 Hsp20 family protein [Pirellulaceae bacterium]